MLPTAKKSSNGQDRAANRNASTDLNKNMRRIPEYAGDIDMTAVGKGLDKDLENSLTKLLNMIPAANLSEGNKAGKRATSAKRERTRDEKDGTTYPSVGHEQGSTHDIQGTLEGSLFCAGGLSHASWKLPRAVQVHSWRSGAGSLDCQPPRRQISQSRAGAPAGIPWF